MTEELKRKAECFRKKYKQDIIDNDDFEMLDMFDVNVERAYIAGATENGIQWHDLRGDPNDLPKDRHNVLVVYLNGEYQRERTFASYRHKYWVISGHKTECEVIAWCEIPQFKE